LENGIVGNFDQTGELSRGEIAGNVDFAGIVVDV
jgi:hypothetical protein